MIEPCSISCSSRVLEICSCKQINWRIYQYLGEASCETLLNGKWLLPYFEAILLALKRYFPLKKINWFRALRSSVFRLLVFHDRISSFLSRRDKIEAISVERSCSFAMLSDNFIGTAGMGEKKRRGRRKWSGNCLFIGLSNGMNPLHPLR